ncbi:MAG: hypothetical protein V1818_02795 [Candidatus Aenigmatarchaeota archaeon]
MEGFSLTNSKIHEGNIGITICKLCGALATDGTIYRQKKMWNGHHYYSSYFELTDEWFENVKLISEWVKEITGKKGSIKPLKGGFRFRIGNKHLIPYLHSLGFPYGKKGSIVRIPEEIMKGGNKYKISFVSSALIFDGSVKLDGTIEFTSISKKLRDQMVYILKENKLRVKLFKRKFERWSKRWKYGFYSKSFGFFLKNLEGPKKTKLEIIRGNRKTDIEELIKLFPVRANAKAPILKELYSKLRGSYPENLNFRELKTYIEKKYNVKMHRNTILLYLHILVKSGIMKRTKIGWYLFEGNSNT